MARLFRTSGYWLVLIALFATGSLNSADDVGKVKTEHFDRDPSWEAFNNRNTPKNLPTVKQDFGFSKVGTIGGQVWRSTTPAYYAQRFKPLSLEDKLSASGTFSLTSSSAGSGVFFGWFNARQPGGGRPLSSLGWYLDGENGGARLYFAALTATNRAHGAFITPFRPGYKPLGIKADGSPHKWSLTYDPMANKDNGSIRFTFDGNEPVIADLPDGFKKEGAAFDGFGLMNLHKSGGPLTIFVSDVVYGDKPVDLSRDLEWEGMGNRVTFQDKELAGVQNFGFSSTSYAGGKRGELGGIFWRTENPFAYYADKVGPLTLDDELSASGKVAFRVGAPDSAMFIGWFNNASKDDPYTEHKNFVGVCLEGPSRVGHYFRPYYATAKGSNGDPKQGPILLPDGKPRSWKLTYDPRANDGNGALRLTLDSESVTFNLYSGHKAEGATLNRFGICTVRSGGSHVKVYFDDLEYTAGQKN